jgi:hypothetical protein
MWVVPLIYFMVLRSYVLFYLFACFAGLIIYSVEVLCLNFDTERGCTDIFLEIFCVPLLVAPLNRSLKFPVVLKEHSVLQIMQFKKYH